MLQTDGNRVNPAAQPRPTVNVQLTERTSLLLRELVSHLRQNRTQLREEWARRITEAKLLTAMSNEEVFAEAAPQGKGTEPSIALPATGK